MSQQIVGRVMRAPLVVPTPGIPLPKEIDNMFIGDAPDGGKSCVTVKKNELLEELKTNRAKHIAEYEEAVKEYKIALIAYFSKQLQLAKKGQLEELQLHIGFSEPDDHTADYDRVIKMVSMGVREEIQMSEQEFSKYVMDDWEWKHHFLAAKTAYMVAGKR